MEMIVRDQRSENRDQRSAKAKADSPEGNYRKKGKDNNKSKGKRQGLGGSCLCCSLSAVLLDCFEDMLQVIIGFGAEPVAKILFGFAGLQVVAEEAFECVGDFFGEGAVIDGAGEAGVLA